MMQFKPGQITPNEFELRILEFIAISTPALKVLIPHLHVLSRKYTGVGSYTDFRCPKTEGLLGNGQIILDALIELPQVEDGLGAMLICENGNPFSLEIFTHGLDHWDGVYEKFNINKFT